MITLLGSPRTCCDGVTRRESLQAGGSLGLLRGGLLGGLSGPTAVAESARPRRGKAKSVNVLYLLGGAPTQDMCDTALPGLAINPNHFLIRAADVSRINWQISHIPNFVNVTLG